MKPQSLHKISQLLEVLERTEVEPGDLTGTLQHIAQTAQTFFSSDDCIIYAINPITNEFMASLTVAGDLLTKDTHYEGPSSEEFVQHILRQGKLVVEDLEATPEYQNTFTRLEDIRSYIALALTTKQGQKPLGFLFLNFRQPQKFGTDDRELFQLFADQVSYILQETWLLQRYEQVAIIGQEINDELDTAGNLFRKLRDRVSNILDISHALLLSIYQPQTNTHDLYFEDKGELVVQSNSPLEGASQYVIENRLPLVIRNLSQEEDQLPFQRAYIPDTELEESLIFVPLVLRGISLGALSIQHPEPYAYSQEDVLILQLLANHIALAIYNMGLYDNLNRLNETGQLLTQQLDSQQVLQATADKICEATRADVVVLYPYDSTLQRFITPPRISGTLLQSTLLSMYPSREDDIATLMLSQDEPIFYKKSEAIYTELHGEKYIRQGSFSQREHVRSTAAVPLRVADETVGVLFVNFRQPQEFHTIQKLLINGLASYAAIAIKNAQAFGTLIQRRVRELETLQKIDRELSRTLDLESVLKTILELAHEHVPADEASILLLKILPQIPRKQVLEVVAAIGRNAEERRKQTLSLEIETTEEEKTSGISRWVFEQKKPALVQNVHRDLPWRDLYIPVADDIMSELDVPILGDNQVIGILNFESVKEAAFRQEDQDFLQTLAGQAVLAIKNGQTYEREKRLAAEGEVLNEISKEITSQLDQVRIFDLILEKALEITNSNQGNLMLYDPDQHDLWMAAERGVVEHKKGWRQRLDQGIVGNVATNKQPLNVDLTIPPWDVLNLDFIPDTQSELAVPMLAGDELRGVLNIESLFPNHFSERDERLLQGLAGMAVVALQHTETIQAHQELEKRAIAAEEVGSIGQSAFELTHRLGNNLGLVESYVGDIQMELEALDINNKFISRKLDHIVRDVRKVLDLSSGLKKELNKSTDEMGEKLEVIMPGVLLEEAQKTLTVPSNIKIIKRVDEDVASVRVFHSLVIDILVNLIMNAIQAMPEGGAIILQAHNDGRSVAIEVSDSGVGIPPQKLSKIFDLFYSSKGGFGFGLWSARRNALKNKGELKVTSELAKGTTFTLILPRIDEVKEDETS